MYTSEQVLINLPQLCYKRLVILNISLIHSMCDNLTQVFIEQTGFTGEILL